MSKPTVAVLDDYQSISTTHLAPLTPHFTIQHFPQTLNPADPSSQAALIARLQPFDIIIAQRERTPLPASTLSALPNLKLILTTGARNRAIDTAHCAQRGIPVAGTSGPRGSGSATAHSTAQHTWALILALARHVVRDDAALKRGGETWQGETLGMNLAGKTLGLVGLGKLGAEVARVAVLAFDMRVVAWSENLTAEKVDDVAREVGVGVEGGKMRCARSKEELFEVADVVSLHYVLSERSRGVVGREELGRMKAGALLVNTSRGPLVEEKALLETLERGRIRGAALDVFDLEPLPADSPWRTTTWGTEGRSEVVLTPHMGYGDEQIHAWYEEVAQNLARWLDGRELTTRLN
ncbi:D-isomer-specific 2-hydroxyacid dehydrogenase family protein [Aspergillus taichungensis]|uniref:D-isomer-specific 2-hydroxyacid dehydrogenase family protein n=1 Tax=Aspergillus taichungensis TaxID=482145 RepID=A0A2J5HWL7_9EURO|nr:D-isomer-specific 2-hydroxyacid dehydrogenase family protein [Aspergillus taichungensis]